MMLKVENLCFSYAEKQVLKNLSFSAKEGEFVTFLGSSGCGKSTLLSILSGILLQKDGNISTNMSFAYMPQDDLLMEWKTVLENACVYGKIHKQNLRDKALKNLEIFGLKGLETKYPIELSGGMKKRVAFLRTVLCDRDILLLDEPFGALDVITRNEMQDWLINLKKSLNKTIILVTHDMDEALYLSDKIHILGDGKIVKSIDIYEQNRTREWLYLQSELRSEIYNTLLGAKNV